ncbi:MAG: radical SAM protein [Sedimentisphaerales bacterium]|nr:radical SAM protein [Sedimentisphaerales bacterium]
MPKEFKYLYGPVPSRRLGWSLGVDIVPLKVCTLDCIYCQLGRTPKTTVERSEYVSIDSVLAELTERMEAGLEADYITIAGSGEPTLNSQLGKLLDAIKKITDIPLTVLTNGTLFFREDVRADCLKADVVLPSLDAGDEETFRRINRPHADISIEKLVSGLSAFRKEFSGLIWLEVFLVAGLNTNTQQIAALKALIEQIAPDKIHLNTAVRPTAEPDVAAATHEKLVSIAAELGERCEVIADFSGGLPLVAHATATAEDVFSMLKRRPCSLADISAGLSIPANLTVKHLTTLQQQGLIESYHKSRTVFFRAR